MKRIRVPVLIVGTGPAGGAAAALLAKYGVTALAISRYPGPANTPRAHITNQRTMEVFRDLGIEDRMHTASTPHALMGRNLWITSFAGPEITPRLDAWGKGIARRGDYETGSPCVVSNLPQHIMEPILVDAARDFGAEISFDTELIEMRQDEAAVHSLVRDRLIGEEVEVISDYAIGADGDNSVVVEQIGFEVEGHTGLANVLSCWLEVDLSRYTEYRPGVLYWQAQPGNHSWPTTAAWISVRPWKEWLLQVAWDPSQWGPNPSPEAVSAYAKRLIGDPAIDVKIKAISKWTINQIVARIMKKGRVMIAGNAAHRHPPSNGLGSNTCVQDSFNLAWKLAMVVKGQAARSLLESYSQERQPVARQIVERAMNSLYDLAPMYDALGFRVGQSSEAEDWASLDELWGDTPRGRERRCELATAIERQNYQFNAQGVELGQVYSSGAVIADGSERRQPERDSELYYQMTTFPGAYLPHAWLEADRRQVSTLDLVGKGRFTLLTGIGGRRWVEAARRVAREMAIPLEAVAIGHGLDADDVYCTWAKLREIEDDGCLLVRPDRHIAYRCRSMDEAPEESLRVALSRVLGRD